MEQLNNKQSFSGASLDFLWVELTNTCNLECTHCYANSSPRSTDSTPLSSTQYLELLRGAFDSGCRAVQFIGGEPTLNKMLPELVVEAKEIGYEFIEVFTNLVALPDRLLQIFSANDVRIATSVYNKRPEVHDKITTRKGSWSRTVRNLRRVLDARLDVRASIVEMEENDKETESTREWLQSFGVTAIGVDRVRQFGRREEKSAPDQAQLCGECSHGKLCVSPEGAVSPCIMSRAWSVGSIHNDSITAILESNRLKSVREDIYANTIAKRVRAMGGCNPDRKDRCGPDHGGPCNPCNPNGHCGPNDCQPMRRVNDVAIAYR